ncbi:hypothetical protein E1A91_D09G190900v1 [Gossypium mustelinum]|uniref:Uncharacterized protein n=1 Tax=Gossypium mustelinum TaxID=34275 RepID=A0A5D2TLF8_GOSMU|nr:hypothetical protein E1A91_D09G190900v1 [Gossypium mustelinum]
MSAYTCAWTHECFLMSSGNSLCFSLSYATNILLQWLCSVLLGLKACQIQMCFEHGYLMKSRSK